MAVQHSATERLTDDEAHARGTGKGNLGKDLAETRLNVLEYSAFDWHVSLIITLSPVGESMIPVETPEYELETFPYGVGDGIPVSLFSVLSPVGETRDNIETHLTDIQSHLDSDPIELGKVSDTQTRSEKSDKDMPALPTQRGRGESEPKRPGQRANESFTLVSPF